MKPHDLKRFHGKYQITKSECWEWQGRRNEHGYGVFVIGHSKAYLAHRVIYEHVFGPITPGKSVLHNCDNRCCVNPSHLRMGTQADNVKDMMDRKRHRVVPRFGEQNPGAKLTEEQVAEIRRRYKPRVVTLKMLAREFGVSEATCSFIINRKRWSGSAGDRPERVPRA